MAGAARFTLSKWYLDCMTAEGDAVIGYVAELRYRALVVRYTSVRTLRSRPAPDLLGPGTTLSRG